jgi:hypothetical protein
LELTIISNCQSGAPSVLLLSLHGALHVGRILIMRHALVGHMRSTQSIYFATIIVLDLCDDRGVVLHHFSSPCEALSSFSDEEGSSGSHPCHRTTIEKFKSMEAILSVSTCIKPTDHGHFVRVDLARHFMK